MRHFLIALTLIAGWANAASPPDGGFVLRPESTEWTGENYTDVVVEGFDDYVKPNAELELIASTIDGQTETTAEVDAGTVADREYGVDAGTSGVIVFRLFAKYGDLTDAGTKIADARFRSTTRITSRNVTRNSTRAMVRTTLVPPADCSAGEAHPSELSLFLANNALRLADTCGLTTNQALDECQFRGELAAAIGRILESRPVLPTAATPWHSAQCGELLTLLTDDPKVQPTGSLNPNDYVLLHQTEAPANAKEYFSSVPWAAADAHRQASAASASTQFLLVQNVPHGVEADFIWKEHRIDASAGAISIAKFASFVVASVSGLSPSIPTGPPKQDPSEALTQVPVVLKKLSDAALNEAASRLPIVPTGHRFIGPIRLAQNSRYELSISQKQAKTVKANSAITFVPKQKVTIDPRFHWDVSVLAGIDATASTAATYESPVWVPFHAAGTGSTTFRLDADRQWMRIASVSVGLALISPCRPGQGALRLLLVPVSVGVPLASPKGISQLTAGFGVRHDSGFVFSFVGGIRFIDQASDRQFDSTIVLANTTASAASAPTIVTTTEIAPVFGINLSFDVGVVGEALFSGVSGLFKGEAK